MVEPIVTPEGTPQPGAGTPGQEGGAPAGQVTDWRAGLPEPMRGEKVFESIKGKDWTEAGPILAKGYAEAQRLIGGSIRLPKPDATPADKAKALADIYAKLGRPETHEKYEVPELDLPEGAPWDPALQTEFLKQAHGLGLNSEQVAALTKWYAGVAVKASEAQQATMMSTAKVLKEEWGGSYDRHMALAARGFNAIFGEAALAKLEAVGLANDPDILRGAARLGALAAEAQLVPGHIEGVLGPEQAKQKLTSIMSNKDHPYFKRGPGHEEALAEVQALHQIIYGTAPVRR